MKRIHLFEFEDQNWFSQEFRSLITDLLRYQLINFQVYQPILPLIKSAMEKTNSHEIIDLCSGSSGSLLSIVNDLQTEHKFTISAILTDKYPNIEAFQTIKDLSNQRIDYISKSVDATAVPDRYQGFRTMFTSFHHLQPELAQKILQDAVDKKVPIGIFEFTERTLINLLKVILFGPLIVWLQTPFIQPFKWTRLLWTYLIPVAPIVYSWDAFVSHLRTYSPEELKQLIVNLENKDDFNWKIGQVKSKKSGFNITYLIGYAEILNANK